MLGPGRDRVVLRLRAAGRRTGSIQCRGVRVRRCRQRRLVDGAPQPSTDLLEPLPDQRNVARIESLTTPVEELSGLGVSGCDQVMHVMKPLLVAFGGSAGGDVG